MATPLTPTPSAALNSSTPTASLHHEAYDSARKTGSNRENRNSSGSTGSSPGLSHLRDDVTSPTGRGPSPPKPRPGSRFMSGHELSPLKILQQQQQQQQQQQSSSAPVDETSSPAKSIPPQSLPHSPRKVGPIKRFPVKVSQPGAPATESPRRSVEDRRSSAERLANLPEVVRENQGLKRAIDIFEDEVNAMHDDEMEDNDDVPKIELPPRAGSRGASHQEQSQLGEDDHDDTMVSTFSAFSGVAGLTTLARMRSESPTKFSALGEMTTPRPTRTSGTTGNSSIDSGNTTNLMDFTEQLRYGAYGGPQPTPSRRGGQAPPTGAGVAATPQRNNMVNLLDFDLPPAPTPRSIPTITPRELESLKSGFLSEISSLKASLSGKEAEVQSLKTAVGDAEKRVGECMEQLREVQAVRELLQTEKDSWERRGRELESVLRQVREQFVACQREREELEYKLDEAEKRREAAEMMAQDAESKMAGMRAGKASAEAASDPSRPPLPSNKEVELAVERVARELHALYKSKHETKVAALKKSYEARWEKKVGKLQSQVDQLTQENEELRHSVRLANGGAVEEAQARLREMEEGRARDAAQIRELQAEVEKVEAVLRTVQADNADLRVLLERERVEKGELVVLAEELMQMQQSFITTGSSPEDHHPAPPPAPVPEEPAPAPAPVREPMQARTPSKRQSLGPGTARTPGTTSTTNGGGGANPSFRMSTNGISSFRASGLRAPGSLAGTTKAAGESRIGRGLAHERTRSAATMGSNGMSGVPRPGSGQGLRSGGGIMSSIERMGGGYGGGGGYGRRGE
ncbi:hypothetical protein VTJ49DRAFT_6169 [Mycothermus thermophilus]|uniref:Uncharacterized protein n=1 Tax=Humicola insolens TaxID=85995 RepID=A0ABR3VJD9_HUMIN